MGKWCEQLLCVPGTVLYIVEEKLWVMAKVMFPYLSVDYLISDLRIRVNGWDVSSSSVLSCHAVPRLSTETNRQYFRILSPPCWIPSASLWACTHFLFFARNKHVFLQGKYDLKYYRNFPTSFVLIWESIFVSTARALWPKPLFFGSLF